MGPFEFVLAIIIVVTIGRVLRGPKGQRVGWGQPEQIETTRLHDEVRQLKERIQVLERVITDNRSSVDLDREIERLRGR